MLTIALRIRITVKNTTHGKWLCLVPLIERKLSCTEHYVTGYPPILLQFGHKITIAGQLYLKRKNKMIDCQGI